MHATLRSARAISGLLLFAACARRPEPALAPTPVVVESAAPASHGAPRDRAVAYGEAPSPRTPPAAGDSVEVSRQDITRQAVNVFGDSVVADSAGTSIVGEGDAEPVSWDIDVRSFETHARVEHYVRYFSGNARGRIAERLGVGTRYEPMIRARFRAAGIPEDMYYLALIESGFDNHAYSRAAAVGMWQFMASTARGMGMRVDWWVDDRRDPVRATEGATRFLRWLNEQLGSYYLAAAAYNGGPGRVSRGLTRFAADMEGETGDEQFFSLAEKDYLPRETKEYVPQLIAAALVAKEPARYGMSIVTRDPFAFDSVKVPAATPLAAVARAAGVPLAAVVELNPHLLRGVTPPTGATPWMRVPVGRAVGFDSAFNALDADDRKPWKRVLSTKGQTPASLARAHGLTVRQLGWYNPKLTKTKKGVLHSGQVVLVPSAAVVAGARDVPDPAVERYGSSKAGAVKYHVVKRGESLGLIAKKNGTTVANLKRLNRLKKDMVYPGQQLMVKGAVSKAKSSGGRVASRGKGSSKTPALSTRAKSPTAKKKPAATTTKKVPAKKKQASR